MKFLIDFFHEKTAIFIAVEKEDYEMVELLLTNQNIDLNIKSILSQFIYKILNQIIFLITFKNNCFF